MIRLTREKVRTIDRLAVETFGIPSILLMENAAIGATQIALEMLRAAAGPAHIFCGTGNNGGDGLAMARHLHIAGIDVQVFLVGEESDFAADARIQHRIVRSMGLHLSPFAPSKLARPGVCIDAILGTGLSRAPAGVHRDAIECLNAQSMPLLAVDVPSGLDVDTGEPPGVCVRATRTVTFVAEKIGFPKARAWTGSVDVVGIGAPTELIPMVTNRRQKG